MELLAVFSESIAENRRCRPGRRRVGISRMSSDMSELSKREDAPKREVVPKQRSLLALATVVAPFARIRQIRLVRSAVEASSVDPVEPSPLEHTFDAITTVKTEDGTIDVRALLTVSAVHSCKSTRSSF